MKLTLLHIVRKSILYNLKGVVSQVLVIILLTAVITGSLMTGKSVRTSLKQTSADKLGNTGILISSGIRFFDPSLAERFEEETGLQCTGLLELEGYCQNFSTGMSAQPVKIYAVDDDFFAFHGKNHVLMKKGEAAINERLAGYLGLKAGEDIIIRFKPISDIPGDAPFYPDNSAATSSIVMKAGQVLTSEENGNFSLGISQVTPLNIFINRSELTDSEGNTPKFNRLLVNSLHNKSTDEVYSMLKSLIKPEDTGFTLRFVPATGGYELISGRIFIDSLQIAELNKIQVKSYPVITYLANRFTKGERSTPYSFIAAVDQSFYPVIPEGNGIVINQWLADDLGAGEGDTIKVFWYSPDQRNDLVEKSQDLIIRSVVKIEDRWADSLLMPEFPGIAGSQTCSGWDAGVELDLSMIRDKDEEYWNEYGGTPKAFISYEKGRELWAGNFGPATSVRFSSGIDENTIRKNLQTNSDPYKSGFSIINLPEVSFRAAEKSVDFSTLFLGLGFFIIVSSVILLILVVSTFYESKKSQVMTFFSLGFPNRRIEKLIFTESVITALSGALIGAFAGGLLNMLFISSLNSVWQGAVQTNTLVPVFDTLSMLTGFAAAAVIILVIIRIRSGSFLRHLASRETGDIKKPSIRRNSALAWVTISVSVIVVILSFLLPDHATVLSYTAGVSAFAAMILILRHYYIRKLKTGTYSFRNKSQISDSYYSFNPSLAIAPVLFLAAGLFAVIITGVNRLNISGNMLEPSGGTGGYLLWGETSVPVRGSLTSEAGKTEFGLDEPGLRELSIVQAAKASGDDASCLNLNHITSPPLLGIDPSGFIRKGAFSFSVKMHGLPDANPWETIDYPPANGTVYGIADQTVLQYGLQIKPGDTLKIRTESGQVLNVIISAGLRSSVFQGYVIIGRDNFSRYFPSISGSQVFLVDGDPEMTGNYSTILTERLNEFGAHFEPASERLASFFVVTNTYLSVFTILGGIGMILGVAGIGLILVRNFNQRKRDLGLMLAEGFSLKCIRKMIFAEHARILLAGIVTGLVAALIATRPSLVNFADLPWKTITVMILLILITGLSALLFSVRSIDTEILIGRIRRE